MRERHRRITSESRGSAKHRFRIAGVFDTETCNIPNPDGTADAFAVAYILNDISECRLSEYVPDESPEHISIVRTESECLDILLQWIDAGESDGYTPIVCAYNLMFDLQTLLHRLVNVFELKAIAQSSTNAYTVDLLQDDRIVLRFWDTFHLELNGLAAMGRTCGFAKATGEWDYNLIRTPGTELTELEQDYAIRDVQVIPAYLRYLLEANDWLDESEFGSRVLTKTSLVRRMAKSEIGRRRYRSGKGSYTLYRLHELLCLQELPPDYHSYALRKACFRGGFTFTSAAAASRLLRNVHSIDVTSMHHAYINGRRIPVRWTDPEPGALETNIRQILACSTSDILRRYDYPFPVCIHACIRFDNLRLKQGSCFEAWGIALLAQSKFGSSMPVAIDYEPNELNEDAEAIIREQGFHDSADGAVFAFGKLYSAASCTVNVTELELWNISQVYEWDSYAVLDGEISISSTVPPDYVTLQSNILYERKNDAKVIDGKYREGIPYDAPIPSSIPNGIADALRTGSISNAFFHSWYQTTVKGAFNGIYGTQAMDVFRPGFTFDDDGDMLIDAETRTDAGNYADKKPNKCSVLYTYGMRIVGGSRMHLVIAMQLLWDAFGDAIMVTGGDTDSLKVCTPADISASDILQALEPLEDAIDEAINTTMQRVRMRYPDACSDLHGIGHFDYEGTAEYHIEAWNKARVSIKDGRTHITCAGLRRPEGSFTIEDWSDALIRLHGADAVLPWVLAYRGTVDEPVSHALEHRRPHPSDMFEADVTDYKGDTMHIRSHAAIALYPVARELGGMLKRSNADNVAYLRAHGFQPEEREHIITLLDGEPALFVHESGSDLVRLF